MVCDPKCLTCNGAGPNSCTSCKPKIGMSSGVVDGKCFYYN